MAALVDTNVLVYRFDPRFPEKQQRATALLRKGIEEDTIRIPHQALLEFVSVASRVRGSDGRALLDRTETLREAEEMLAHFTILYPTEGVVRTALRGSAAYQLSWFDAHLWAYAEHYGLEEILSEDFEHDRLLGSVRIRDPFV